MISNCEQIELDEFIKPGRIIWDHLVVELAVIRISEFIELNQYFRK